MRRHVRHSLAWCLVLGLGALSLPAADEAGKDAQGAAKSKADEQATTAEPATMLNRASDLVGKTVKNEEGKDLGKVEDVVVDPGHGRIAYVVLSFPDGFANLGEKFFAIPFEALNEDTARKTLLLNVAKQKLENAEGFDKERWPDMADEQWARNLHKHYGFDPYWERQYEPKDPDAQPDRDAPRQPGADNPQRNQPNGKREADNGGQRRAADQPDRADTRRPQLNREHFWVNRVSKLMGKAVKNNAQEKLGTLKDIIIDMREGRLVYGVVTDGGTLGISENLTAVPWAAFDIMPEKEYLAIDSDKAALKALSFKEDSWPDMTEQHWAQMTHDRFQQEPYWIIFGYARVTAYSPVWRGDSDYNKLYDPAKVKIITGTVTSVGEFTPVNVHNGAAKDGSDALDQDRERDNDADSAQRRDRSQRPMRAMKGKQITLRTSDGQSYVIHLGPSSFIDRQEFKINEGDKITASGALVSFQGKQVVLARSVTKEGKVLDLRDIQGRPKWDIAAPRGSDESDRNTPDRRSQPRNDR